jgi:hypothetical protein
MMKSIMNTKLVFWMNKEKKISISFSFLLCRNENIFTKEKINEIDQRKFYWSIFCTHCLLLSFQLRYVLQLVRYKAYYSLYTHMKWAIWIMTFSFSMTLLSIGNCLHSCSFLFTLVFCFSKIRKIAVSKE